MDVRELKKILSLMNEHDLIEIEIEEEGRRLRLRKASVEPPAVPTAPAAPAPEAPAEAPAAAGSHDGLQTITAPMVGTFYTALAPDQDSYVEVAGTVGPNTVVCILEAMKVMNEIKADCSGEIVKICVQNAEAVEYGQALFLVKPA